MNAKIEVETKFAILNQANIVLCVTTFSPGLIDVVKYSNLKIVGIGEQDVKVGDVIEPIAKHKYVVGDVLFVYMHQKNFVVSKIHKNVSKTGVEYENEELLEFDPANPKQPHIIFSNDCRYPIVSKAPMQSA